MADPPDPRQSLPVPPPPPGMPSRPVSSPIWAKDQDGKDLVHSNDEELKIMEPGCLEVLREFSLKSYVFSSLGYYKARPAALRREILSGITLALIEVPESIAFAFMAGLSPSYGMASVVWLGTLTGMFGGRPAMISGAAGAMAVVMGDLTREDGPLRDFTRAERVEHLLMCVVLIGAIECLCAPFLCGFVKIIPQSAMIGFMNALAIILVKGQTETFRICATPDTLFNDCPSADEVWLGAGDAQTWSTLALIVLTLFIMWGLPKVKHVGHIVPASLAAIVVGTAVEWGLLRQVWDADGAGTRTVGETAELAAGMPGWHFPDLPASPAWGTIWAYAASLALIGGVETVMTHEVVNSLVKDPPSSFKANQECVVQGIANLFTGLFQGMGGSALVGETVINVLHGARGRLSSTTAGLTMLFIMLGLSPAVRLLPIAVLTGIIWSVALHTFQWRNLMQLHKVPRADAAIIILVTALSVVTNLAIGIAVGVAAASVWHVWSSGRMLTASAAVGVPEGKVEAKKGVEGEVENGEGQLRKVYRVQAPLFFGSTRSLLCLFDYLNDPDDVVVDLSASHGGIQDLSGITALNEAGKNYEEVGKSVTLLGLNPEALAMIEAYPDAASHLRVPALRKRKEEKERHGLDACLGHDTDVLTLGPDGLELGLEMGVENIHPPMSLEEMRRIKHGEGGQA